jgi:hypothetical protein
MIKFKSTSKPMAALSWFRATKRSCYRLWGRRVRVDRLAPEVQDLVVQEGLVALARQGWPAPALQDLLAHPAPWERQEEWVRLAKLERLGQQVPPVQTALKAIKEIQETPAQRVLREFKEMLAQPDPWVLQGTLEAEDRLVPLGPPAVRALKEFLEPPVRQVQQGPLLPSPGPLGTPGPQVRLAR